MKSKAGRLYLQVFLSLILTWTSGIGLAGGSSAYQISGRVIDSEGARGLTGISLYFNDDNRPSFTDPSGNWSRSDLSGPVTIKPFRQGFIFEPSKITVTGPGSAITFRAMFRASDLPGKIAFASGEKIRVVTPNGGNNTGLPLEQSMHPTWAPCGCYIAYQHRTSGRDWQIEIYGTKDQKNYGVLTEKEYCSTLPSWSPKGPSIAYVSQQWGNPEICVKNIKTKALTRLTEHPGTDTEPAWSPDASKIIFASDRSGRQDIWEVAAQGGTAIQVISDASHPSWSARNEIAFVRDGNIFVREADGTTLRQLTTSGLNSEPSWSTDGSWITFISNQENHPAVYIMYADGSHQIKLTNNNTAAQHSPEWYSK